ncbi:6-phospho-beta-glucosidase [Catenulispora sp. NL8]|uniref:6-phospho-beta-glucosidase n=1 Tax=Catenulispora pinistramenti TaxID=2705254 RepID=A0ABS5KSW1_9ACTN|nr:6-phospho-beta-glucosidase [Catenulispora pinistramenti]MBS2549138.1 6-phospho-beta-glucosidase [Catenulispora pinistramenti]
MKIVVVGGGSTYTPELVDGFARLRDTLAVDELVLIDPDAERVGLVGGVSARILAKQGHPGRLVTGTDLDEHLDGAAAVLLQLRVGGQAARHTDETLPLMCGCVGQETTGAGGLAKALRTVPVVLDIADRIRKRAPEAWIVDFTNPVGIVTRALLDAGHKAVGLCNVAKGFQHTFGDWFGVDPGRVELDHVGLNHLTWERGVRVDGVEVLPRIFAERGEQLAERVKIPIEVMRRHGAIPSYYLRFYYAHDAVVAEQLVQESRAHQVAALERQLLQMYADPALEEKPALLDQRGGAYYSEAAIELVAGLLGAGGTVQVANVRNGDTMPFLSPDAVIEVPCRIDGAGAHPLPIAPIDPLQAGLIAHVAAYEELALQAALYGGIGRVEDALIAHPLIGQTEPAQVLAAEMVSVNRDYLPWAKL